MRQKIGTGVIKRSFIIWDTLHLCNISSIIRPDVGAIRKPHTLDWLCKYFIMLYMRIETKQVIFLLKIISHILCHSYRIHTYINFQSLPISLSICICLLCVYFFSVFLFHLSFLTTFDFHGLKIPFKSLIELFKIIF